LFRGIAQSSDGIELVLRQILDQGASSAKKRQPPVLDLRGLIVERGLFVDQRRGRG
jgi:hypothetical protein